MLWSSTCMKVLEDGVREKWSKYCGNIPVSSKLNDWESLRSNFSAKSPSKPGLPSLLRVPPSIKIKQKWKRWSMLLIWFKFLRSNESIGDDKRFWEDEPKLQNRTKVFRLVSLPLAMFHFWTYTLLPSLVDTSLKFPRV